MKDEDPPKVTEHATTVAARCPQCGSATLIQRHCKLVCEACGYVESCEDNFPQSPMAPVRQNV